MRDIVVIMGSHKGTRLEFDWSRVDCDIWLFNEAMKQSWAIRADAVFQLHKPVIWRNPNNRNDPNHYAWLQSKDTPEIIMQEVYEDVPNSTRYPIEDIMAINKDFLSSSIAQAIALAIYRGYKQIEVYGVEMETDTEYRYQRDGVAWWCGYALGRGVQVDFHSITYKYPVYGYEGDIKLDYQNDLVSRLEELKTRAEETQVIYSKNMERINKMILMFGKTGLISSDFNDLLKEQISTASTFGLFDGAKQEIERYIKNADDMILANGDFSFSRQEFEQMAQVCAKKREEQIAITQIKAKEAESRFEACGKVINSAKRKSRINTFVDALGVYIIEAIKVGIFDGASRENVILAKRIDALNRAAGGERSVEVMLEAIGA